MVNMVTEYYTTELGSYFDGVKTPEDWHDAIRL